MIPVGTILAGKYQVERVLGQGGMGVVVKALHLHLQQPVAIKFLLPEVLSNAQVVQRFMREAQAAVRLKSEHVARVIDVGALDNGAPYIVMEYLNGVDLSHLSREQLTVGELIDLMLQACEALAEAHSIGIVHRDIKPANFFITQHSDGTRVLKVLDFGISKTQQALDGLTATSMVMGTPAYMSPEQMRSAKDVDNRSDIWSVGVVLYELLQGTPPFEAETFGSMAIKVATEPLPPLRLHHLPPGLAEIVYRCLEKDPARRFQNIAELSFMLAPFAHSTAKAALAVERTSRVLGTEPPRSTSMLTAGSLTSSRPQVSRKWPYIAGLGVVIAATVLVALVAARGRGDAVEAARTAGEHDEAATQPSVRADATLAPTQPLSPDAAVAAAPVVDAAVPVVAPVDATGPAMPPASPAHERKQKRPKRPQDAQPTKPPDDDPLGTRQ